MASKIKEKILDELTEMYNLTESETKQSLLVSLAEAIDKQDDDRNIRNILWANRDLTMRMFTGPEFQVMPSVGSIVTSPAPSDTLDYDKEFGKDWYKNPANIPLSQIQFIADKNGLDWKAVSQDMAAQATALQRDDIAHGRWDPNASTKENIKNEIGGTLMTLFGRRQQEAIARGEEPTLKDYAGDVAENGMYAIPWGRALGAVAKGGKVARVLTGPGAQYAVANTAAPIASETYDAIAYDNDNPRGEFSIGDVGTGIATNMVAPATVQRVVGRFQRYIPISKHMNAGGMIVGKSKGQIAAEMGQKHSPMSKAQSANTKIERALAGTQYKHAPDEAMYDLAAKFTGPEDKKVYDAVLKKIKGKEALSVKEREYALHGAHPELADYYNLQYNPKVLPTGASLAAEESLKSVITNEAPNLIGDESLPWYTRLPGGILYYRHAKEEEEAEQQRKKEQDIEDKWKIRFGVK